jgi:hypothetical protein
LQEISTLGKDGMVEKECYKLRVNPLRLTPYDSNRVGGIPFGAKGLKGKVQGNKEGVIWFSFSAYF